MKLGKRQLSRGGYAGSLVYAISSKTTLAQLIEQFGEERVTQLLHTQLNVLLAKFSLETPEDLVLKTLSKPHAYLSIFELRDELHDAVRSGDSVRAKQLLEMLESKQRNTK